METSKPKKKTWVKPEVALLDIKKDTFSGSVYGNENVTGKGKTVTP
jgi:hypothetical protein